MKQVECNKCGKHFEVEGEWGYCPFCENDNVEVKKNLEDLIDEAYDDIEQTAYKKESMALAYHGNCDHYFQYPEDYEQDLESEVERLQEELVKKDKEITQRLVIQEKDYYEELNEIKQQLALTEKSLELACEELNRVEAKFGSAYIRANGYLVDYFKTEAKELI